MTEIYQKVTCSCGYSNELKKSSWGTSVSITMPSHCPQCNKRLLVE